MKTLDEVIKALEECMADDAIESEGVYLATDALHYLKEYKDKAHRLDIDIAEHHRTFLQLGVEIARYQEAVRNCEEAENKYRKAEQDALKALDDWASRPVEENKKLVLTVDNPPLDWEQLKQMIGKPVWVEGKTVKHWAVITGIYYDDLNEGYLLETYYAEKQGSNTSRRKRSTLGKSWQAYRKERE